MTLFLIILLLINYTLGWYMLYTMITEDYSINGIINLLLIISLMFGGMLGCILCVLIVGAVSAIFWGNV